MFKYFQGVFNDEDDYIGLGLGIIFKWILIVCLGAFTISLTVLTVAYVAKLLSLMFG